MNQRCVSLVCVSQQQTWVFSVTKPCVKPVNVPQAPFHPQRMILGNTDLKTAITSTVFVEVHSSHKYYFVATT